MRPVLKFLLMIVMVCTVNDMLFDSFFSDSADLVVQGSGKFEELVVWSHEIAASTAQLVAASRVGTLLLPRNCVCV